MGHTYNKKKEKEGTEGKEWPNKERIRIREEKETCEYLWILDADNLD